jgi:hypothetical protein
MSQEQTSKNVETYVHNSASSAILYDYELPICYQNLTFNETSVSCTFYFDRTCLDL